MQLNRGGRHHLFHLLLDLPHGHRLPPHGAGQGVAAAGLRVLGCGRAALLEAGLPAQETAGLGRLAIQAHCTPRHDGSLPKNPTPAHLRTRNTPEIQLERQRFLVAISPHKTKCNAKERRTATACWDVFVS